MNLFLNIPLDDTDPPLKKAVRVSEEMESDKSTGSLNESLSAESEEENGQKKDTELEWQPLVVFDSKEKLNRKPQVLL